MNTLYRYALNQLSRREFLRYAGSGLSALFLLPYFGALPRQRLYDVPSPADDTLAARSSDPSLGRVLGNSVGVYEKPSFSAKLLKMYHTDLVQSITAVTIGDENPSYNRIWYELDHAGYAHSGDIQPVEIIYNQPIETYPGYPLLAEVTVPFTDSVWNYKNPKHLAYRLYYSAVFWINDIIRDESGKTWYSVYDDKWFYNYYVEGTHLRPIVSSELTLLSPNVPLEARRLEVRLADQVVVAYEDDRPVFMSLAATGAHFRDGNYATPTGHFITSRKRPSRHMAAGDRAAPNSYDLPGIPWVSYLTDNGISFHGTYWHNDFGKPRSHGCINLSSEAALWVYRWSLPHVPASEETYSQDFGTAVDVV
jgi:hypothetical protein